MRRELKIARAAASRTSRCFFWWWNTVSNAWYYFSNKMILPGEIKDAKMSSLHLISKHSSNINFLFVFSLWIIDEFEKDKWRTSTKNCPYVQIKNFNQNNFLFDVGQRDWSRIRVVFDVDEKWNEWKNKLMTVISKCAPVKKKRVGRKTFP